MTGSRSGSSVVELPGCGMQLNEVRPHRLESNSATARLVGPVKVELAGVVQSTWNSKMSR